ncbi:MAG: DUF4153 domain-containing protein [Bacteroidales bacterium]|nr:DUF4153 domain-containing protein [Bacteroidales bacterium]
MSNIKTQIKDLIQNLKQVFLRFPLACFFALVLSVLLSYLFVHVIVNTQHLNHEELFFSTCWACGIAILLAFVADLFCHFRNASLMKRIWCNIAVVLVATASAWLIYTQYSNGFIEYYFCTTLFVTLLLTLVWPTWGHHNIEMTWNYHIRLIFAIAVSYLLAHIIIFGIVAILLSIQYLFNIDTVESIAVAVAVVLAFFCPCCTMALMPIHKDHYNKPLAYGKFLKVLVLYILLPLVCIEALVLYIYAITILVSWQLPEGGVAYWVFSYAIAASIVWYLLMPVFRSEQPSKLKFLDRGFFISLIPLLVLLFVGLFRRIHDYGFTTNRYIVLVIACWFLIIALVMIFRKSRNVTPLLCSLIIISLLALVGPWSMFSLPKSMQIKRFEQIANEYHLLENGKIKASAEPLSREQNIALSESIDFFMDTKKYQQDFAEQYFNITPAEGDSIIKKNSYYYFKEMLMYNMNGEYISEYDRREISDDVETIDDEDVGHELSFYNEDDKIYSIAQYDYAFSCTVENNDYRDDGSYKSQSDDVKLGIWINSHKQDILHFDINNNILDINVIDSLNLESLYKHKYGSPLESNEIFHEDAHVKLYLNVKYCSVEKNKTDTLSLNRIRFDGFVKLKN